MARPLLLALLLAGAALPVHAQTGGAGGQGASTAPGLRYGAELLLGRSHAQGGGGAGRGQDRDRVVLRRHGAETMPAIQAGQIGQAARLEVQEPERPNDTRLLTGGGGRGGPAGGGRAEGRIIPFGAERTVEGGGGDARGQGSERPRLVAFPPRDPSTAPGASRAAAQPGQARPGTQAPRPPVAQARPAQPSQARPAAPPQQQAALPPARQAPPANALQSLLPGGNRFSDVAHEGLPTPPILSDGTRAALDRLNPRQQEAYRASVRDMARSNPGRTLSEPEVRLLVEAAQSR